jgi:hypothetical protein
MRRISGLRPRGHEDRENATLPQRVRIARGIGHGTPVSEILSRHEDRFLEGSQKLPHFANYLPTIAAAIDPSVALVGNGRRAATVARVAM